MGIGGGIISKKLLFTVLLAASMLMTGIAGASASEVGYAQKQAINYSNVQDTNENTVNPNILENSAPTQKKADVFYLKKFKKQKKAFKKKESKQGHRFISSKREKSATNNKVTYKPVYSKNIPLNKSETIETNCNKSINSTNVQKQFNSSRANQENIQAKNQYSNGTVNNSEVKNPVNEDPLNNESSMSEYLSEDNNNLYGNTSALNDEPAAAAGETKYLTKTANCDITSPTIKAVAAALVKGKTTTMSKAVAIFNYVRDKIAYSFYYNTKKGAVGTVTSKSGNCCDTTHLLIALMRAAGIPAKYVHVKAKFTSGNWYGHVYANVWVNGKWYSADATSSKNSFGTIKNWSLASCTLKGIYASLPF